MQVSSYNPRLDLHGESKVSFGFRMVMMAGLLCASMAAHAEYKEVWNPPEAAAGGHHGVARATAKPAKPVKPKKTVAKAAPPKSKEKMKSGAVKQASAPRKAAQTASRPTHASSTVVASQTPHASSNAPKSSELPPILK